MFKTTQVYNKVLLKPKSYYLGLTFQEDFAIILQNF